MRKTLGVCSLVLLLTCSARAGIIQNEQPAPPPPSQPANAAQEPTDSVSLNGEIHTPPLSEGLTQITLQLLAVLL
jgi:hypothetical protein